MLPTDSPSSLAADDCAAADRAEPLFISVIMPVRNEAKFIERTLCQLVAQDYDSERFELLVVDGESSDGTPDLVRKFAERRRNVSLDSNPRRWGSAARNIAVRKSRGDIVLLVDGHCELNDRQYLRKLADAFRRSGADCVGRPQPLDIEGASTLQRAIAAARSSRLGHHPDSFIYSTTDGFVPAKSVAVAYRRSVFDQVGYFDETFDACEDVEFNHRVDRAGLRCYFTPDLAVHYAPRDSLRGLFRQLVRYGRGRVRLARKHPETFSIRTFLPALFVVGCLAGLGMIWLSTWLAGLYLAVLAAYTAIVLSGSTAIAASQRNASLFPWLPLVFLAIHAGSGVGLLMEPLVGVLKRRSCGQLASYKDG
jgi:succinoglycan biosynthesis protein ExoA